MGPDGRVVYLRIVENPLVGHHGVTLRYDFQVIERFRIGRFMVDHENAAIRSVCRPLDALDAGPQQVGAIACRNYDQYLAAIVFPVDTEFIEAESTRSLGLRRPR